MYPSSLPSARQQYGNSQIELSVSARKLVSRDVISKSDALCVVSQLVEHNKYIEIGRTEVIKDDSNPNWVKKFIIPYQFNVRQVLRFEVFDFDPISNNEFLGRTDVALTDILAVSGGVYMQPLKAGTGLFKRVGGEIWIQAEEVNANKQIANFQFSANNLDKKDFLGKSDPYLVISRSNRDGTWSAVHKTEVIMNSSNPTWRAFSIRVQSLCNGDFDRQLKFECYDWDDGDQHDLIGAFVTTLRRLSGSINDNSYEAINEKKKAKKSGYRNSGIIRLNSLRIEQEMTSHAPQIGGFQPPQSVYPSVQPPPPTLAYANPAYPPSQPPPTGNPYPPPYSNPYPPSGYPYPPNNPYPPQSANPYPPTAGSYPSYPHPSAPQQSYPPSNYPSYPPPASQPPQLSYPPGSNPLYPQYPTSVPRPSYPPY